MGLKSLRLWSIIMVTGPGEADGTLLHIELLGTHKDYGMSRVLSRNGSWGSWDRIQMQGSRKIHEKKKVLYK